MQCNRSLMGIDRPSSLVQKMSDPGPGRTARYVAAGILVSRAFGFVRTWAFARFLGDTAAADAFNAALKIPNVIRNLLGEGAISASFIPVYSALLGRGEHESARRVAGAVLGILLGALSLLTIVGIASAPTLARILAPGFDPERYALTVRLLRVLFPMTGLMVISGWCLGVQNSHKSFLGSYASAALWSLTQIALLLGLGPHAVSLTDLAWWLAWATLAGSVLQVAAQLPQVLRLVRPLSIAVDPHNGDVREILANFIPVVVSLGLFQISSFVDLQIASWLPSGSVSQLSYATTLYLLPIGLFSVSVSASALPEFARDNASISFDALRQRLRDGWMRILFYIIPASLLFVVYGNSIVALLYRSGRFGVEQERAVHLVLAAYSVGLVGYASIRLLASALYAVRDYRTPLRAAALGLLNGTALSLALTLPLRHSRFGAAGLALGAALGSYVNMYVLVRGLRRHIGPLFTPLIRSVTRRIALATLFSVASAALVHLLLHRQHYVLIGIGTVSTFGAVYLSASYAMGSVEAGRWLRVLRLVRGEYQS